jgi:4-hydroxybenzoate polyprenyltransferase
MDVPSAPGWLALTRFRQWGHLIVLPLAGAEVPVRGNDEMLALARGVAIGAGILSYGYLLNALADRTMDRDWRKNPLAGAPGLLTSRLALVPWMLAAVTLGLAATGPIVVFVAAAVPVFFGALYSVGPRLKAVPIVGTLLNAVLFGPLLLLGVRAEVPPATWALAFAFAAMLIQNQLLHEAADAREDADGSVQTTFLFLGPVAAAVMAAVVGSGVPLAGRWIEDGAGRHLFLAISVPMFSLAFPAAIAVWGRNPSRMAAVRGAQRWFGFIVGAVLFVLLRPGT